VIEPPPGCRSFIQIGILGLDAMARKLAAGVCRITPPTSGFHGQWVLALNGFPGSGREGGWVGMERWGCWYPDQFGKEEGHGQGTTANAHVFMKTAL